MQLRIDGKDRTLIPLSAFCEQWHLPETFCVAHFEPKSFAGLGSLEDAGAVLTQVKAATVDGVPPQVLMTDLPAQIEAMANLFQHNLEAANPKIGLRQPEIDFARAGFEDILHAVVDQLVRLYQDYRATPHQIQTAFDYAAAYQIWLNNSVQVGTDAKTYQHREQRFTINLIYDAYGRVGMKIQQSEAAYYVADTALGCPAAGYMYGLCEAVAKRFCQAFVAALV